LSRSISGWVSVREFPSGSIAEESYIRHMDVQRVSMVENADLTYSVLVHALGSTYLYAVLDTDRDARLQLECMVQQVSI
jgi:hypothetical protein